MAAIDPRTGTTRNGHSFTVRSAEPDDDVRFGFVLEGRRRASIRLDDRRVDDLGMAVLFPPKPGPEAPWVEP